MTDPIWQPGGARIDGYYHEQTIRLEGFIAKVEGHVGTERDREWKWSVKADRKLVRPVFDDAVGYAHKEETAKLAALEVLAAAVFVHGLSPEPRLWSAPLRNAPHGMLIVATPSTPLGAQSAPAPRSKRRTSRTGRR